MPAFDKAELAYTLPWDADWVSAVAMVGNRFVAAGNNLGQILVWELPDQPGAVPMARFTLEGHTNQITRLRASKDGTLYSASFDHTIRVWRLDGAIDAEKTVALNSVAIAESKRRNGKKIDPLEVKVKTIRPKQTLENHKEWINAIDLSRDEKLLISGDDGSVVIVWDREKMQELHRWKVKGWAYACALSPDNKQAIVTERFTLVFDSGRHAGVKLWDVVKGEVIKDLSADFKNMYMAAAGFTPDGQSIILGRGGECDGPNGKLTLVNTSSGKKTKDFDPGHLNGLTDFCVLPDDKHIASTGRDTLIRIWEIATGRMVKELGKSRGGQFKDWTHAVSASVDGKWLVAADMVGAVQLWRLG